GVGVDDSLFSGPTTGPGWDGDVVAPGGQVARIQALMTNAGRVSPVHHEIGPDPRFADPALAAGRVFAGFVGAPRGAVVRGRAPAAPPGTAGASSAASGAPGASATPPAASATPPAADAPVPGTLLGEVSSPPLVQIVDWML